MHYHPYLRSNWVIPNDEIRSVLRKQFTIFYPFFGVQGCLPVVHCHCGRGLRATQGPQKPEGSRCSEMHSQPYLSPKWVIPDENSSCFEKNNLPFLPFSWCAGLSACVTLPLRPIPLFTSFFNAPRSQRVLDALRCILSLIWDPFIWCAG